MVGAEQQFSRTLGACRADTKSLWQASMDSDWHVQNDCNGSLCDIHRCALYGRYRGHSGHQPSELSARPAALAISLSVTLLGGLSLPALKE
jgi:hypothetical protein